MQMNKRSSSSTQITVSLIGDFDAHGTTEIRQPLEALVIEDAGKNITLDLNEVRFMDSSGVGAVVFLFKRLKTEGLRLDIVGVRGQPRQLLELLRIHKAIPVVWGQEYADQQEGVA